MQRVRQPANRLGTLKRPFPVPFLDMAEARAVVPLGHSAASRYQRTASTQSLAIPLPSAYI